MKKSEQATKWLIISGVTLACAIIAVIPEAVMYILFHFINPTSEVGRIATGGLLLWFGTGLSILFAIGAFVLWCSFVKAACDVYGGRYY